MKILIIEDNQEIISNIYGYFESLDHVLDNAQNGYSGLALVAENDYDVIILDVMLPGVNGYQVCNKLRNELKDKTPVLMLTARDTIEDRVEGFDSGADDYLAKPFSLVQLEARLKALVRRSKDQYFENTLRLGSLRVNPEKYEVFRENIYLELTPTGFKILKLLLEEYPHVVEKRALEKEVWGEDLPNSDALKTHIHTLRQVIDKPFNRPMLKTVPGVGYRLVDPDE